VGKGEQVACTDYTQAADERVVAAVSGIGVGRGEDRVDPVLGQITVTVGDIETEAAQTWCTDLDEKGFDGFATLLEVPKASGDQIAAGLSFEVHARIVGQHPQISSAAGGRVAGTE